MPRTARKKSKSGIYHIILRGINRQIIFEDDEDREKYLQTTDECKALSGCRIYGYCLMGNHIHMLVQECDEDLGIFMRRIGARYVYWYNFKYKRCGHLFQDRYKRENVDNNDYFLTVLRYIHQNPVKAGITKNALDYPWSSYHEYFNNPRITEIDYAFNIFDKDRGKAKERFKNFQEKGNNDNCLDIDENRRLRDEEALEIIMKKCETKSGFEIQKFSPETKNIYLRELKKEGISTRQLERLTGISRAVFNGCGASEELYYANNRIKKIRIEFSDGNSMDAQLKDGIMSWQKIDFGRYVITNSIKITILEVYKGTKYTDTRISDILFYITDWDGGCEGGI